MLVQMRTGHHRPHTHNTDATCTHTHTHDRTHIHNTVHATYTHSTRNIQDTPTETGNRRHGTRIGSRLETELNSERTGDSDWSSGMEGMAGNALVSQTDVQIIREIGVRHRARQPLRFCFPDSRARSLPLLVPTLHPFTCGAAVFSARPAAYSIRIGRVCGAPVSAGIAADVARAEERDSRRTRWRLPDLTPERKCITMAQTRDGRGSNSRSSAYLSGMKRAWFVAPIPGRPCVTGL